jgi:hypothetical protein
VKTFGDLRIFVRRKLDLQEEIFITPEELVEYIEEALKECEAEIHKLQIQDQYFTSQAPIELQAGLADYALPSNIYANKILRIVYTNGSDVYTVRRSKRSTTFEDRELLRQNNESSTAYSWEYALYNNDVRTGTRMRIYPTPQESATITNFTGDLVTGSTQVTNVSSVVGLRKYDFVTHALIPSGARIESISGNTLTLNAPALGAAIAAPIKAVEPKLILWFIRQVSIPTEPTDPIDVPEFWNFITQHVIVECLKKELGNPRMASEKEKLEQLRLQMIDTLSEMVPDQDDGIEKDMDFYYDMETGE